MAVIPLYPKQVDFLDCPERFAAFAGGIGSGKSFILCYNRIRSVRPGGLFMVVAPTYPMLRDATTRSFIDVCRRVGTPFAYSRSEHRLTFLRSKAEVLFRSSDNPEALRGPNLSGVDLDEASLMPRDVYDIAIGRLRQGTTTGTLRAAFTPKGPQHWTHEVFNTGQPDTRLVRARTDENPFLPADFADTVRRQYGDTQFMRQELGGEFVSIEGAEWPAELIDQPGRWFRDWPDELVAKVIALDPSKGAREDSDYQAFAVVGMDRRGTFYVDVEAHREGVAGMIERGISLCKKYRPDRFVVEDNDGLGMLAAEFRRQLRERFVLVPLAAVCNTVNKVYRLRGSIGGYLSGIHPEHGPQLRVRDTPGGRLLVGQMRDFPLGEYDDALDALELALRALGEMFGR